MPFLAAFVLAAGVLPSAAADFSRGSPGNFHYRGAGAPGFAGMPRFPRDSRFAGDTRFWANRRISDGYRGNRNFAADPRGHSARDGHFRYDGRDYRGDDFRGNGFAGNDFGRSGYSRGNDFGNPFPRRDRLKRTSSSPDFVIGRGSGVNVIISNQSDTGIIGNYAGAGSVYRSNGGTYVIGNGSYGGSAVAGTAYVRPRAKIVDLATANSACSQEAGVCVIRP